MSLQQSHSINRSAIPFESFINFDYSRIQPEQYIPVIQGLVEQALLKIDRIKNFQGTRTVENTLQALDCFDKQLNQAYTSFALLDDSLSTAAHKLTYGEAKQIYTQFRTKISLDKDIYNVLSEFSKTPNGQNLTSSDARYLSESLMAFERNGVNLDVDAKAQLTKIEDRLASLSTQFKNNVVQSEAEFSLHVTREEEIEGLPEVNKASAQRLARSRGLDGYILGVDLTMRVATLKYLTNRDIREKIYRAYISVASNGDNSNLEIAKEMLSHRSPKSSLLGFDNYCDLVAKPRMAKTGKGAYETLQKIEDAARPKAQKEFEELQAFAYSIGGPKLEGWDVAFYAEKLSQTKFDFDEQLLIPYFESNQVLKGALKIAETLFGITIKRDDVLPTWDPLVQSYAIYESDGSLVARFYADPYSRPGLKVNGAWHYGLKKSDGGAEDYHLSSVTMNFPVPTETQPSLLTFKQVKTVFHELGHLFHFCLSKSKYNAFFGTRVAKDAVEIASMLMEEFLFSSKGLGSFARHHETGLPIPDEYLEKIIGLRRFRNASFTMATLAYCFIDFAYHLDKDAHTKDILKVARDVANNCFTYSVPDEWAVPLSFTHIFPGGYAGGYYTYPYAELPVAEIVKEFENDGLISSRVGRRFRDIFLSAGNDEDALVLINRFLGKDETDPISVDAYLARAGFNYPSTN